MTHAVDDVNGRQVAGRLPPTGDWGELVPTEEEWAMTTGATSTDDLAAELAALRKASEARDEKSAKTRRALVVGGLLLVLGLLILWETGRMDPFLSQVGLNKNTCIKNGFGATFCGADATNYEKSVANATGAIDSTLTGGGDEDTLLSEVRAAIPSAEAYYSTNGSYAGMTKAQLLTIDNSIGPDVRVKSVSASTYCLEADSGSNVASATRGEFPVDDGNVVPAPC